MFNRIQHCRNKVRSARIHYYDFFSKFFGKFCYCNIIEKYIFSASKHVTRNQKPVSQFPSGKLFYKILPCNKSGNSDLLSKEVIFDCNYL